MAEWRPDSCLDLELQESFYGRIIPLRFWQIPSHNHFGDDQVIALGKGFGRGKELDPVFFEDVGRVVENWLSFWSGYSLQDIQRAFLIQIRSPEIIDVHPNPEDVNVLCILNSLIEAGATLRPTLH